MLKKTVFVSENPLEVDSYDKYEVDDVLAFIKRRFPKWPTTARLYHKHVAKNCDVTPTTTDEEEALKGKSGPFYVIVYPGHPAIIAVIAVVASVAASYFLRPSIPKARESRTTESPNNDLSSRTNRERVNGRIPDIYGKLRAVPDLLAKPYSKFDAHEEIEYCLLGLGRGSYEFHDFRDGRTPIQNVRGSAVEVYGPYTDIPGVPELRIGNPITEPLYFPTRVSAVNGQELRAPQNSTITEGMTFKYPNEIHLSQGSSTDMTTLFDTTGRVWLTGAEIQLQTSGTFTVRFWTYGAIEFATGQVLPGTLQPNDVFTLANPGTGTYTLKVVSISGQIVRVTETDGSPVAWYVDLPGDMETVSNWVSCDINYGQGGIVIDLDGIFNVLSVEGKIIVLDNPAAINAAWNNLSTYPDQATSEIVATLATAGQKWVGPFEVEFPNFTNLTFNFVAPRGLYFLDETANQGKFDVTVQVEVTPVLSNGALGAPETQNVTVYGSATSQRQRAATLEFTPSWAYGKHSGKCQVRVSRVTQKPSSSGDTYTDEVAWRDLYAMCQFPPSTDLGNITTLRVVQRQSAGALLLKEREFNCLVTRKLPKRVEGTSTFTTELFATRRIDDILCAICLDPKIGRRQVTELDVDNIYSTVAAVEAYFGKSVCVEFAYTFDDSNVSFEESVTAVAAAGFCLAYRQGNQIKLRAELPTNDSVMLFNHRNKVPGSETRTIRFGMKEDYDGIEFEYTSPLDDTKALVHLPPNMSATNPKRVESIGVRSKIQAYYHAARYWNKLKHQNIATEFEATQEADLLLLSDRILVADNTRPDVNEGEVEDQVGLTLTLSQPVTV